MRKLKLILVGMLLSSVSFLGMSQQGGACIYMLPDSTIICYVTGNAGVGSQNACMNNAIADGAIPMDCLGSAFAGCASFYATNGVACFFGGTGSCGGGSPCSLTSLPIELLSFNGENTKEGNVITWSTASEIDNDYFILETSTNLVDFETVVEINGAGNSKEVLNYRFVDNNITEVLNYYRLTQVDFNGERESFHIVAITSNKSLFSTPYPNPSNGTFNINYNGRDNEAVTVEIISIEGRTMLTEQLESFNNVISIEAELSKGVYILRLTQGSKTEINNIVIK